MTIRKKLLATLVRWLGDDTPEKATVEAPKQISNMVLEKSGPESNPKPMQLPWLPAGVIPSGTNSMAMDSGMVAGGVLYSEEMHFLGYGTLSTFSKYSEYRSPTETLATEMTRQWISFKSTGTENRAEELKQIEAAFDLFKVRDTLKQAIEHDGFFGRGMVFVDMGMPELNDTPLIINKATIQKGGLKGFKAIEPMWTAPAQYNSTDPTAPDFYKPSAWYVNGKTIHKSRLEVLIARPLTDMLKPAFNFSGMSMTQLLQPAVNNFWRTRDSISDLVHSFSLSGIKTDMDAVLSGGDTGSDLINRAKLFNQLRDNRGLMLLDKDTEEFFQLNTPLSGLHELQSQAQEQMAAPCHTPLVKLFGITPNGLNASSEGEIKVYYDYIKAMQQNLLTDPLVRFLQIIQLHLFGEIYSDITFEYCPLEQMDDLDLAAIRKSDAERDVLLVEGGIILTGDARKRLSADPMSGYSGMEINEAAD